KIDSGRVAKARVFKGLESNIVDYPLELLRRPNDETVEEGTTPLLVKSSDKRYLSLFPFCTVHPRAGDVLCVWSGREIEDGRFRSTSHTVFGAISELVTEPQIYADQHHQHKWLDALNALYSRCDVPNVPTLEESAFEQFFIGCKPAPGHDYLLEYDYDFF